MLKKFLLLVPAMLFMAVVSFAQQPCSTDEHYRELVKKHPELLEYEKQFQEQMKAVLGRKTAAPPDTTTYDVPIVVHIVHDYGAENIADNVIFDAVSNWAEVFMAQNSDTAAVIDPFKPYVGNPGMRLHLATKDPNGNPTKGIVRTQSYLTLTADDQAKFESWPNNKYINIWFINKFGSSGAAAYAYYPSSGASMPYYDGIIGLYTYVDYAKVIPHELGHVLNLAHVWGSTNNPAVACGDDNVDDTPPTMGHTPVGCVPAALYDVTCAAGYLKHYTAVIGGGDSIQDYPDTVNSQNIMDYTYCQLMFSKGQCFRMRTALTNSVAGRNNLITSANLAATGALAPRPDLAPKPEFIVNKASSTQLITDARGYFLTYNNPHAKFSFRNASWNDTITGVSWSFSNSPSVPTSSSTGTVINTFGQPGWVEVTLTATSNAGSTTLVEPHAVYAADPVATGGFGYQQQFNAAADINNWPMFNYYNNQFKWEFFPGVGYNDNNCVRFHSFDTSDRVTGTATGDRDDLFTPAFDLAGVTDNVYLNFFTTGANTTKGISGWDDKVLDSMEVLASNTGGARWTRLAVYKGTDLANEGKYGVDYVPTAPAQWKARAILIPEAFRTSSTFFRFRYRAGNAGNNMYLDNFSVSGFPAGVEDELSEPNAFKVFPNPATNGCNIIFKTGRDGMVSYCIKDITGKVVYQGQKTFASNTTQQVELPRSLTPAAGLYFVTVTVDGMNKTEKLVVY